MSLSLQDMLDEVNNVDNRTVWDCIDRPMRRLVFEMNRVGFYTKFCCFGYPYDKEEEPKFHHSKWSYVHFYVTEDAVTNKAFDYLVQFVNHAGLHLVRPWPDAKVFDLRIYNLCNSNNNMYRNYTANEWSIHDYEYAVMVIHDMSHFLQEQVASVSDTVKIVDGNGLYSDVLDGEWQVKPKPDFIISVEDFYKQYGKLDKRVAEDSIIEATGVKLVDANFVYKNPDQKMGIVKIEYPAPGTKTITCY